MLTTTVLPVVGAAFGLALLLTLGRLLRGPSVLDRLLALDTLYVLAMAVLIVVGIALRDSVYFEVGLLIAVFGFVGTVAASRYVLRGSVTE
jgi:multicomponent K+:H+ antiporter subunit F